MALIDIFKKKKVQPEVVDGTSDVATVVGTTSTGHVVIASNVDWKNKGIQDAGCSNADLNAFHAGFQSVFAQSKKSQELDSEMQEKMKATLQKEIGGLEGEKSGKETKLEQEQEKLKDIQDSIDEKNDEKSRIKSGVTQSNRTNTVNLWIGTFLITLLTVYLFIFYSSTAYSVFFRDWSIVLTNEGDIKVIEKIFDGEAIVKAFQEGPLAGLFVLFLPIVFMALGYVAHHTGKNSQGFSKYAKVTLMYLMTFAFDFLLAYNIGKHAYDAESVIAEETRPLYNVGLAIVDSNFLMVIFCGFVAYVIWGLLYGFVMDCYNRKMDNTAILRELDNQIARLKDAKVEQQNKINELQVQINQLIAKIKQKQHEYFSNVRYDFEAIKQHLADYYKGWVAYMGISEINTGNLATAHAQEMALVNDWMDGIKNRFKQKQEDNQ